MDRFFVTCIALLSFTVLLAVVTGDTVGLTGMRTLMV